MNKMVEHSSIHPAYAGAACATTDVVPSQSEDHTTIHDAPHGGDTLHSAAWIKDSNDYVVQYLQRSCVDTMGELLRALRYYHLSTTGRNADDDAACILQPGCGGPDLDRILRGERLLTMLLQGSSCSTSSYLLGVMKNSSSSGEAVPRRAPPLISPPSCLHLNSVVQRACSWAVAVHAHVSARCALLSPPTMMTRERYAAVVNMSRQSSRLIASCQHVLTVLRSAAEEEKRVSLSCCSRRGATVLPLRCECQRQQLPSSSFPVQHPSPYKRGDVLWFRRNLSRMCVNDIVADAAISHPTFFPSSSLSSANAQLLEATTDLFLSLLGAAIRTAVGEHSAESGTLFLRLAIVDTTCGEGGHFRREHASPSPCCRRPLLRFSVVTGSGTEHGLQLWHKPPVLVDSAVTSSPMPAGGATVMMLDISEWERLPFEFDSCGGGGGGGGGGLESFIDHSLRRVSVGSVLSRALRYGGGDCDGVEGLSHL